MSDLVLDVSKQIILAAYCPFVGFGMNSQTARVFGNRQRSIARTTAFALTVAESHDEIDVRRSV